MQDFEFFGDCIKVYIGSAYITLSDKVPAVHSIKELFFCHFLIQLKYKPFLYISCDSSGKSSKHRSDV